MSYQQSFDIKMFELVLQFNNPIKYSW